MWLSGFVLSLLPPSPQIQKVILALGDYMGAACHACIGGTNLRNEIQKLQAESPHIVVGTPGRVFDMLTRGHLCECWWGVKVRGGGGGVEADAAGVSLQIRNRSRCSSWMKPTRC